MMHETKMTPLAIYPEEQLRQIVSLLGTISQCIYILDRNGNFVYVNNAWVRYTETPKKVLLRKNVHEIRHTFKPSILERVLETGHEVTLFQDIKSASGTVHRQLATATPAFNSEGEVSYIIVTVTPLNAISAQIQEAQENEVSLYTEPVRDDIPAPPPNLIAASPQMQQVLELARRLADTGAPCLLTGESGTGKGVVAQYIHSCGRNRHGQFVTINCAAIPENLMESELFGYEPGAFTGARREGKLGCIEAADGGTLFLDEINSLPLTMQGKLLRVLETKMVKKLGASREKRVDFRIIAAANQDLYAMCQRGEFREDLYYRLNIVPVGIPPLRQRKEDIVPLTEGFLRELCAKYGKYHMFSPACYQQLLDYNWPGNVRELRNFVERIIIVSSRDAMVINSLPPGIFRDVSKQERDGKGGTEHPIFISASGGALKFEETQLSLKEYLDNIEKEILETMAHTYNSTYKMAETLKINQSSVVRKLQKFGIKPPSES